MSTVFFYSQDWFPHRNGTGTNNRVFSNLRAYLDLNFEVEVVYIETKPAAPVEIDRDLSAAKFSRIRIAEQCVRTPGLPARLAFRLGFPLGPALECQYRARRAIRDAVLARNERVPGALHHFEYVATANAVLGRRQLKRVLSYHDVESDYLAGLHNVRRSVEGREPLPWERASLRVVKRAERRVARESDLVLCIACHDKERLTREWGVRNAAFFPMSMPDENVPIRTRPRFNAGKLRLLHLGRIDSLPSYTSLDFLLRRVLPRLTPENLAQIEMLVVGEIRDSSRARAILDLGRQFPQIRFLGFQKDIRRLYGECDLQVVGSTDATGLRTRIIESFAFGLPVLSTTVGANGVEGAVDKKTLILADTPDQFASALTQLLHSPQSLEHLAARGEELYRRRYSRSAVAACLGELLGDIRKK